MVALKPVAQTARLVVSYKWLQRPCVNVFHWFKAAPVTPFTQAEIDGLASSTVGLFGTHFAPVMDADVLITGCTATDLSSETGRVGVGTASTAGTLVGTSNPASVALCITWTIARHYRGGHPRSYMAGTVQSDLTGIHQWNSTRAAAWNSAASAFRTAMNGLQPGTTATGQMVAVHRFRNKLELDPPLVSPITGNRVDIRIDSQRRRTGPPPVA